MTVKLTHKRSTKNNDFKRLFVDDGLICWYIHLNFGKITHIRERMYKDDMDDVLYEKVITDLPLAVAYQVNKFLTTLK